MEKYAIISRLPNEKFQKKLFELGFGWYCGKKQEIVGSCKEVIFVQLDNKNMTHGTKDYADEMVGHYQQITLGQLRRILNS